MGPCNNREGGPCNDREGWEMEGGWGGRCKREGTYVYLRLIQAIV